MFPQMGAATGFLLSSGTFFLLSRTLTDQQFLSFGWRIPFIASALLVLVGLYVRLKLAETPDFIKVLEKNERSKVPFIDVFTKHTRSIVLGTLATVTTFLLFYLMTVFTLSWGTTALHYSRTGFLIAQMGGICFFGLGIPISAVLADRYGRNKILVVITVLIFLFGLFFSSLFGPGNWLLTICFLVLGMFLMGLSHGTIGTALAEIFPASVRYTGASLAFTLAGVLGASPAPAVATRLATNYGLSYVGYYISFAAVITLLALLATRKMMKERV